MSLRISRVPGGVQPIKEVHYLKKSDNAKTKKDKESKEEGRRKAEERKKFFEYLQEKAKESGVSNNSYNKVHKKVDISNRDRGGR